METLTADEMRAVETEAIESGRVTGLELMERAGQGVEDAIFDEWPELADEGRRTPGARPSNDATHCPRALVLCGPGNNGGDGFVVARLLHARGWEVEVFLFGALEKLPPDARTNCNRWMAIGDVARVLEDFAPRGDWRAADLVVDALFGTGLTRPLEDLSAVLERLADTADRFKDSGASSGFPRVVAVDMPSGIHTDTGKALVPSHGGCPAAHANLTVTFHKPKAGHRRADGPEACGKLVVKDIGL